jgi:hypothetical protein
MSGGDLAPLVEIAEAADQAAQARLARAAAQVRRLQDEIAALRKGCLAGPELPLDPGTLGAMARHEIWIEGQRRRALQRLAQARAEQEAALLVASQTFGRLSALRDLDEDEAQQRRRDRSRRSLALSPLLSRPDGSDRGA